MTISPDSTCNFVVLFLLQSRPELSEMNGDVGVTSLRVSQENISQQVPPRSLPKIYLCLQRRAEHPSRETPPNCSLLGSQHPTERGSSRELLSCRSWDQPSGEEDEEQHAEQCPEVEDDRGIFPSLPVLLDGRAEGGG